MFPPKLACSGWHELVELSVGISHDARYFLALSLLRFRFDILGGVDVLRNFALVQDDRLCFGLLLGQMIEGIVGFVPFAENSRIGVFAVTVSLYEACHTCTSLVVGNGNRSQ